MISSALIQFYREQLHRALVAVLAAVMAIFRRDFADQSQAEGEILSVVEQGQAFVASMVDGFMAQATGLSTQGLDTSNYTVSKLRSEPAPRVYSQPWAAMVAAEKAGAPADEALAAALARLDKLVATDMQLAQTHAARDWVASEPSVIGWRRVTASNPCELCRLASTRIYHKADLAPIHEHCECTVVPVLETREELARTNAAVRVVEGDIGPRLMADNWEA